MILGCVQREFCSTVLSEPVEVCTQVGVVVPASDCMNGFTTVRSDRHGSHPGRFQWP